MPAILGSLKTPIVALKNIVQAMELSLEWEKNICLIWNYLMEERLLIL